MKKYIITLLLIFIYNLTINAQIIENEIVPIDITNLVKLEVDSLNNKDRTHNLKIIFKQNHPFKRYRLFIYTNKICTNRILNTDEYEIKDTIESEISPDTVIITRNNLLHSAVYKYQVIAESDDYTSFVSLAETPQSDNDGSLLVKHNTTYMLPLMISSDSSVNYDTKERITIYGNVKSNNQSWFNPSPDSGQNYASSWNNVGNFKLWECNSKGEKIKSVLSKSNFNNRNINMFDGYLYPPINGPNNFKTFNYYIKNDYEVNKDYYFKIESFEAFDSCNSSLSNLLTIKFRTRPCSTNNVTVINNNKNAFRYRFTNNTLCSINGWEARFYKLGNNGLLLASDSTLNENQLKTMPLGKVLYRNFSTNNKIILTRQEIRQGYFERNIIPRITFGNSWYRIDIVCTGCLRPNENIKTIYTYIKN